MTNLTLFNKKVTINEEKYMQRCSGVTTVLTVFSIASICKYGFKEHMRRAWCKDVGKQCLLGLIISGILFVSCIERDEEEITEE